MRGMRFLREPRRYPATQNGTPPATRTAPITAIEVGKIHTLFDHERGENHGRLRPDSVVQRNWSRVGVGVFDDAQHRDTPCFIKQYLDRTGGGHPEHLEYEADGARIAEQILGAVVTVPTLMGRDDTLLVNLFERIDLITVDELLRRDEKAFWRYYPLLLEKLGDVLKTMANAASDDRCRDLPVKRRSYSSRSVALNFKGFEIRNTGYALPLPPDGEDTNTLPPVVMFDFVRPYLAPVEEAGAKLLVSIGLLNWGTPVGRFLHGPDEDMLDMAFEYIGQWTNRAALEAEMTIQRGFRFDTIKGATLTEKAVKKIGLNAIGRRYLKKIDRWIDRRCPA